MTMNKLLWVLNSVSNLGWLWLVSLFYPVYWTQDLELRNRGFDLLSLRSSDRSYFRGTYWKVSREVWNPDPILRGLTKYTSQGS